MTGAVYLTPRVYADRVAEELSPAVVATTARRIARRQRKARAFMLGWTVFDGLLVLSAMILLGGKGGLFGMLMTLGCQGSALPLSYVPGRAFR
jgi:hypothetical protein